MKFHDLTIPKQSLSQYFVLLLKHHFEEVEFFWDWFLRRLLKIYHSLNKSRKIKKIMIINIKRSASRHLPAFRSFYNGR